MTDEPPDAIERQRGGALSDLAYRFGDYRFWPRRHRLLRDGRPVQVGSRALDLLWLLVIRAGELVDKAELIAFAWPKTFVHESNLKVNIAALRRALTGPAEAPYIVTIPGRGYRFVGVVRIEADSAPALLRGAGPAGLPAARDLVGRAAEIESLREKLAQGRLVTLVGPAGVGKTTLATATARSLAERYQDGACFVDLAAIADPRLVPAAIALAIGSGGTLSDMLVGIVETLRGRRMLLVLDNCEHVLAAASLAAEHLVSSLADLTVLATSREPLRARAETVHRLAPLPCPDESEPLDSTRALAFAAVALFARRAGEATGYRISDADAPILAEICRRLDGLPLAIELAAPRLASCDPATLLGRIDRRLEALSFGPAAAPIRHQALLATLDWSYRLLSDGEAALFRLVSVFAGTFTLGDVIGIAADLERSAEELARHLESLAAKSLLTSVAGEGGVRYRLLDTTRCYAAERLRGAGEEASACAAHARYLLREMEEAERDWQWRVREDWTAAHGPRLNDVRAAIDWALGETGDAELGVRLTAAAIPLWDELSSVGESRQRVQRALRSPALAACAAAVRMKLATAYAWGLTYGERLDPAANSAWRESLRLAELAGDADYQLRALWGLAALCSFNGRHRETLACLDGFDIVAERENDRSVVPDGERLRVVTEFYLGDVTGAHDRLAALARRYDRVARRPRFSRFQIDHYIGIRVALTTVAWVCGRPSEATAIAAAALDAATDAQHVAAQSNALAQAVIPVALWTGKLDVAERHLGTLVANLNQRGLAIWAPLCRFYDGMIGHGRGAEDAIARMRTALDDLAAHDVVLRLPMFLAMLAEAALREGRHEVARASIASAFERADRQEERWCRPELLRVAALVRARTDPDHGAHLLLGAVRAAEAAGALSFELRAAVDLAGRWAEADRVCDAVALLEPVCRRFSPHEDAADVVRARRLLARLDGRSEPAPALLATEARPATAS